MRDQLHLMELVDHYLDGTMSTHDRSAFEERLRGSEELRSLVEDQQRLRRAAQRASVRATVKKAYRGYRWGKWGPGLGAGAAVVLVATAVIVWQRHGGTHVPALDLSAANAIATPLPDTLGTRLPAHVIMIDPRRDTTLATPGGIVLDVPQGAFLDSLGRPVTQPVRMTMVEALTPTDIMRAGLSTMSGDTLLETGGMFYVDARTKEGKVKIDPTKPLTAMVPADEKQATRTTEPIPEARVRHILLNTQGRTAEEIAALKLRADSILTVLKKDRSKFPKLVARFSDDQGSRNSGGVYEWFGRDRMVPEFTKASFDEPVGAITICRTEYGYHIVEILDRRLRSGPAMPSGEGGMMRYEGVRQADGRIDWRNPKPLKKSLVPVDIRTLNFYPPGYEAKLAELGEHLTNKAFKDSLYFAMSPDRWSEIPALPSSDSIALASMIDPIQQASWQKQEFRYADTLYNRLAYGEVLFDRWCASCHKPDRDLTGPALKGARAHWAGRGDIYAWTKNSQAYLKTGSAFAAEIYAKWNNTIMTPAAVSNADIDAIYDYVDHVPSCQGIEPAKVKTIWQPRFDRTNLATRDFEERMRALHYTCDNAALDVYANNLDKDLSWCDSIVSTMGHLEFAHFADRNDGRVDLPAISADRLRRFYERQSQAEADAIRRTQEHFWREQRKEDALGDAKRNDHEMGDREREAQRFQKELEVNLDTVYKQLGYTRVAMPRAAYVVPVTNPGWCNVDKPVLKATTSRTNMSYTDPKSGKTATLTYVPLTVEVEGRQGYDELSVYLVPAQLNSYQRMREQGSGFTEQLNSIFSYDLVCLGIKGGMRFATRSSVNAPGKIRVALEPKDENELRALLRDQGRVEKDLLEEARYLQWSAGDRQRRSADRRREELMQAIRPVVFPCWDGKPAAAL